MPRQARAGPDFSPGISRDQVLKLFVEGVLAFERAVDVLIAEHGAAHFHPFRISFTLIHRPFSYETKNFSTASENGCGNSILDRCAPSNSLYCEPAICAASHRPSPGGVAASCVPLVTRVLERMRGT